MRRNPIGGDQINNGKNKHICTNVLDKMCSSPPGTLDSKEIISVV